MSELATLIRQQNTTLARLSEAIEQNNQLIVQVLQVNSALLESLSDESEDVDSDISITYLDGSKPDH